jgi:uncharacterized membrane protein HdeD (DUF308 family)
MDEQRGQRDDDLRGTTWQPGSIQTMNRSIWDHDRPFGPSRGWGWILAYGILLAVVGGIALVEPLATGLATGFFVAYVLIAGGFLGIVAGFSGKGWRNKWLDIAVGLLSLILGLLVLWNPFVGAFSLVWAIGFWLVVIGMLEISAAFRSAHHRGWLVLPGIIDIVLGIALLFAGPATALLLLAAVIGISFIFRGAFLVLFALRLCRLSAR